MTHFYFLYMLNTISEYVLSNMVMNFKILVLTAIVTALVFSAILVAAWIKYLITDPYYETIDAFEYIFNYLQGDSV